MGTRRIHLSPGDVASISFLPNMTSTFDPAGTLDDPTACSDQMTDWLFNETSIEHSMATDDYVGAAPGFDYGSPVGSFNEGDEGINQEGTVGQDGEDDYEDDEESSGHHAGPSHVIGTLGKEAQKSDQCRAKKPNGDRNREACKRFRSKVRQKRDRLVRQVLHISAEVNSKPITQNDNSIL
jgi:hypothetical protein